MGRQEADGHERSAQGIYSGPPRSDFVEVGGRNNGRGSALHTSRFQYEEKISAPGGDSWRADGSGSADRERRPLLSHRTFCGQGGAGAAAELPRVGGVRRKKSRAERAQSLGRGICRRDLPSGRAERKG